MYLVLDEDGREVDETATWDEAERRARWMMRVTMALHTVKVREET